MRDEVEEEEEEEETQRKKAKEKRHGGERLGDRLMGKAGGKAE